MTDTERIMPRQPIEAERVNRPPAFRSLGREVLHHDGHETFLSARYWHEVSDPIVWDGTDLAWVRVRAALPAGMEATARVDASMTIYRSSDDRILATVIRGGRIRIEGDSFVILPPEVKS